MPDAPLSRRARRTFEEEAADRAALVDPTLALGDGLATTEFSGVDSDGVALSRRDRRRLERLAQPLEAWTAEEEMIATGHIPTMTPERIAEHERASREKAIRAAADAESASQEIRALAEPEMRQPAAEYVAPEPEYAQPAPEAEYAQPAPEAEHVQPAPEYVAPEPEYAQPAPEAEHVAPEPEYVAPEPEYAQPAPEAEYVAPEPEYVAPELSGFDVPTPASVPYQPRMVFDDKPLEAVTHAQPSAPSVPETPPSTEPAHGSHDSERSRVFAELFPQGSNQAALRDFDPYAKSDSLEDGQASALDPASNDEIPVLLPPDPGPAGPSSAADEIRRLAAEAMSGIERAARTEEPAKASTPPAVTDPSVAAEFASLRSAQVAPAPAARQDEPESAPRDEAPSWGLSLAGSSEEHDHADAGSGSASEPAFDTLGESSMAEQASPSTPAEGLAPREATFDQLIQSGSGAVPTRHVDDRQPAETSGQLPTQTRSAQQLPTPAWGSQPAVSTPIDVNQFEPISNAPQPDFSGLYQQSSAPAFNPAPGEDPTPLTSTGQFATVRRPDLPEVGGAKHFKWLHLAVIGALMFVLGVVIYNVAFAQ